MRMALLEVLYTIFNLCYDRLIIAMYVFLYEILRKKGCISIFVVGRPRSEYGPPMAVIRK